MLLYPRAWAGLPLLLIFSGSALPRAVAPAIFSALLAALFEAAFPDPFLDRIFVHPYPYQVFATILGFAVVFRLSQAYARYWEGITHTRMMSAKWGDAALEVLSFDCHVKPAAMPDGTPETETLAGTRRLFYATIVHRFSLMHALACGHLRREIHLREAPPATIDRPGKASMEATVLQRPIKASARPIGTCLSTFWAALWPKRSYDSHLDEHPLPVLGGLSDTERRHLERLNSETRVGAAMATVMGSINARRAAGGLWVDPPAVSRVHQVLSDGMLGFQSACKLEDTPLPFAYSQMVSFTLVIFACTFPLIAASKASGSEISGRAYWLAPTLTFIAVMTYFLLHEVRTPYIHTHTHTHMRTYIDTSYSMKSARHASTTGDGPPTRIHTDALPPTPLSSQPTLVPTHSRPTPLSSHPTPVSPCVALRTARSSSPTPCPRIPPLPP